MERLQETVENALETNESDDSHLVQQAQAGDREAFGELIRRHRARIYGYARTIAHESFLAEDIVQDAMIRAFLHLGTLTDSRRFLPWLHRIVRNQAYTKLKGRSQKKELAFSELASRSGETEDWTNLDNILLRLSRSVSQHQQEEWLVRQELLDTITGMLRCLNRRERQVFEAHFFDHWSPQEIARLFSLSSANVYQILSRSRKKLVQEKIRVSVDHILRNRRDWGSMSKRVLKTPGIFTMQPNTWTTCAAAMHGLLEYTDRKLSLPMVMGLGGLSFRLNIVEQDVHIAGPTMFSFGEILSRGLKNMGFRTRMVGGIAEAEPGPNLNLIDPGLASMQARQKRQLHEALSDALALIHRSIDRGYPVMAWDLYIPEFAVIYGYNDEKRELVAGDNCGHSQPVPYEHLGRGILEELFVLAIDEAIETDERKMLTDALRMILDHYHGQEPRAPRCVNGLNAYDTWSDAYRGGTVEPNGNAYNLAVVQDARRHAAEFLQEVGTSWHEGSGKLEAIRPLSLEAAAHYRAVAETFAQLCRLFPFPAGGEPNEPGQAERAIQLLETAKKHEQEGVAVLERMYVELATHE